MPLPGAPAGPPAPPSEPPVADSPPNSPLRSGPLRSGAPKEAPSSGQWSLILGAVAISSIGLGFLLFGFAAAGIFRGEPFVWLLYVALGLVGFGSVLALPGMALGVASQEHQGRSYSAGVAGCLLNGLILGVWLWVLASSLLFRR
jgi:hypothetical protein